MKVLLAPHVSEKSSMVADVSNQVAFKVATDAIKPEIKAAVELLFNKEAAVPVHREKQGRGDQHIDWYVDEGLGEAIVELALRQLAPAA